MSLSTVQIQGKTHFILKKNMPQCSNVIYLEAKEISKKDGTTWYRPEQIVPCGKCGNCLANRRADWTFRLQEQLRVSKTAKFVTITYSDEDENMPFSPNGWATLDKTHVQKFMKRLRKAQAKYTDRKIKFYAVGEYGTETLRPHYHIILFDVWMPLLDQNRLEFIWSKDNKHNGGQIKVDPLEDGNIHYITKHHVNSYSKIIKNDDDLDMQPQFSLMSKGLGKVYAEKNGPMHRDTKQSYVTVNGYKKRMPKYLKEQIFDENTRKEISKENRINADENRDREYRRLASLGYKYPYQEFMARLESQSKKYNQKSDKGNLF